MTTRSSLTTIIDDEVKLTGMSRELIEKLVTRIDRLKVMGYTGGEAASKFADYLGFLCIPDDAASHEFFARRWSDSRVWIEIDEELKHYIDNNTPLFTISRLEPVLKRKPFYMQGISPIKPGGKFSNPFDGCEVRKAPPLDENYSNFIINANLPSLFYMEVSNFHVERLLSEGHPPVSYEHAHRLYATPEEARESLFRDLSTARINATTTTGDFDQKNYTLVELPVEHMRIDSSAFSTRYVRQVSSTHGYYYTGAIEPGTLRVSTQNLVH